jgi:DNA-binding NtrC family response regulator
MLRDQLAFVAARHEHVLITGPSGSGKELCARAIHSASVRAQGPFVARNAVTLPGGLIDAELFGNARNFPNPGMRERAGLIGESERGTLFLDELGELPEDLQAHLLRVLDDGAYHRLGEDRERRADIRLIGATNRPDAKVKHDLAARLKLRLEVPGLAERREDIPVLARHLLRKLAEQDSKIASRFFEGGEARMDPELIVSLTQHDYVGNTRELERLLLGAIARSPGNYLAAASVEKVAPARAPIVADDVTDAQIRDALAQAGGNVSSAWRLLGLSSRDALNRLLKKRGIQPPRA